MSAIEPTGIERFGDWDLSKLDIVDMHIPKSSVLSMKRSSLSSVGVFKKFNIVHPKDGLLYVKSGSSRGGPYRVLQPITEKICSDIGKLLGFNVVASSLWTVDRRLFLEIEDYSEAESGDSVTKPVLVDEAGLSLERTLNNHGRALVSVTRNFLPLGCDFVSCERVFGDVRNRALYDAISQSQIFKGDVKDRLHQMMVFDCIIHNQDRHTKNFGFILNGDATFFSALFDHGLALLSEYSIDEISEYEGEIWGLSPGKPFGSLLASLKLVDKSSLWNVNFSVTENQLTDIIDRYAPALDKVRVEYMKATVSRRWKYVKQIFS